MKQGKISKQQWQKQPYKSVYIIKYTLSNIQCLGHPCPYGQERVNKIGEIGSRPVTLPEQVSID